MIIIQELILEVGQFIQQQKHKYLFSDQSSWPTPDHKEDVLPSQAVLSVRVLVREMHSHRIGS